MFGIEGLAVAGDRGCAERRRGMWHRPFLQRQFRRLCGRSLTCLSGAKPRRVRHSQYNEGDIASLKLCVLKNWLVLEILRLACELGCS